MVGLVAGLLVVGVLFGFLPRWLVTMLALAWLVAMAFSILTDPSGELPAIGLVVGACLIIPARIVSRIRLFRRSRAGVVPL